ncbi:MAG: DUF433 domain-containing protein [Cyclobacteriaceae bacterium]|nr:DUF433 domain-containing protein [Cyclobacteriaceae bacterium]
MKWQDKIVSDNDILLGKPVIRGTRITVAFILDRLANGWSEEHIIENYPNITREDIQAVFSYLNDCVKDGLLVEVSQKSA